MLVFLILIKEAPHQLKEILQSKVNDSFVYPCTTPEESALVLSLVNKMLASAVRRVFDVFSGFDM